MNLLRDKTPCFSISILSPGLSFDVRTLSPYFQMMVAGTASILLMVHSRVSVPPGGKWITEGPEISARTPAKESGWLFFASRFLFPWLKCQLFTSTKQEFLDLWYNLAVSGWWVLLLFSLNSKRVELCDNQVTFVAHLWRRVHLAIVHASVLHSDVFDLEIIAHNLLNPVIFLQTLPPNSSQLFQEVDLS